MNFRWAIFFSSLALRLSPWRIPACKVGKRARHIFRNFRKRYSLSLSLSQSLCPLIDLLTHLIGVFLCILFMFSVDWKLWTPHAVLPMRRAETYEIWKSELIKSFGIEFRISSTFRQNSCSADINVCLCTHDLFIPRDRKHGRNASVNAKWMNRNLKIRFVKWLLTADIFISPRMLSGPCLFMAFHVRSRSNFPPPRIF